jgi:hypothetical protein
MQGYTKLFGSILASTIWREPDTTRLVWITMLALSDKHGVVEASVPGLAALSRVSEPAARMALATLSTPDPDSRSQLEDGRRIVAVDGGWLLVTHAKYRAKMNRDLRRNYLAVKQRECRARRKVRETVNMNVNSQPLSTMVNPVNLPDKRKKKIRKKDQRLLSEQAPTSIEGEFPGFTQDEASHIASLTTIQQSVTETSTSRAIARAATAALRDGFVAFWAAYPARQGRKNGKQAALDAWMRLAPSLALQRGILGAVGTYAASTDLPCDAVRWLKGRRWEDEKVFVVGLVDLAEPVKAMVFEKPADGGAMGRLIRAGMPPPKGVR